MPFWRLFYHLVWTTAHREPLIDKERADTIARSIRETCREPGIQPHAIGIMPDHVHVAVSIPPRVAVATFVGRLKGAASYAVNHTVNQERADQFGWQAEYGVLSFGQQALSKVVAYVKDQPARHAANQVWTALECSGDVSQPA